MRTCWQTLRLFERLAPSTDDPEAWAQLPAEITVYRSGSLGGFSWTTDPEVAERFAREYGLAPTTRGKVAKTDVLAFITGRGEDEIVVRPGAVGSSFGH